jgi:hypothetical protein
MAVLAISGAAIFFCAFAAVSWFDRAPRAKRPSLAANVDRSVSNPSTTLFRLFSWARHAPLIRNVAHSIIYEA